MRVNIGIFASGKGTNTRRIIEYFKDHSLIKIDLVVCNNTNAGVLEIADENKIPTLLLDKENFFYGDAYLPELKKRKIDFIVLAGFLWKIPKKLLNAFPEKIINIHPALLPKYGGKGMYGGRVHKSVIADKEKESGITIHVVDEEYDHGKHLFQAKCLIDEHDSPDMLAQKIHELEQLHFPLIIEKYIETFSK